jgi:hypothetical protein
MKRTVVPVCVHLGLAFLGVLAGTAASAPVNGLPLASEEYVAALVFSPLEMTIGIPLLFNWYSPLTGTLIILGAVVCIISIACSAKRSRHWTQAGALVGGALWSLGNVPVLHAIMSV